MEHVGNFAGKAATRLAGAAFVAALALAASGAAGCSGAETSASSASAEQVQGRAIAQTTAHLYAQDETSDIDVMTLDSMPSVPYVRAEDFLGDIYVGDFSSQADGAVYTLTGPDGDSVVIDADAGAVHFDAYEEFMSAETIVPAASSADYVVGRENVAAGQEKGTDIELSPYGIDVVADGGSAWLPLSTLSDLVADTYCGALWIDGEVYFANLMDDAPYYDEDALIEPERPADLAEFTYDELCFVMDELYGAPARAELSSAIEEKGFDAAVAALDDGEAIREGLKSTDTGQFLIALAKLEPLVDDGGHTVLTAGYAIEMMLGERGKLGIDMDSDEAAPINDVLTDQLSSEFGDAVAPARAKALAGYETVREWEDEDVAAEDEATGQEPSEGGDAPELTEDFDLDAALAEAGIDPADLPDPEDAPDLNEDPFIAMDQPAARLVVHGETALFSFDGFAEETAERFKWSLDYAAEHGLKNFVIDLTCNHGGLDDAVLYMRAIMSGKAEMDELDTLNGNVRIDRAEIDRNLDGTVDGADDDVVYDLRFAVLESHNSFSCANLLPALAKDDGILVLGERSGGGSHMVQIRNYPSGPKYGTSSTIMLVNAAGEDIDGGVEPHVVLVEGDDYSGLYDLDRIVAEMDVFYANAA